MSLAGHGKFSPSYDSQDLNVLCGQPQGMLPVVHR